MALDAADALDPIRFGQDNHIHDFVMHPHRPLVCGALVDGSVQLYEVLYCLFQSRSFRSFFFTLFPYFYSQKLSFLLVSVLSEFDNAFRFEYSSEGHKQLMCSKHHKDSARALCFSSSGSGIHKPPNIFERYVYFQFVEGLFTASKDCSMGVIDVNELKIVSHLPNAHNSPINVVQEYDDNILVTGDDVGELAVCSTRLCLCRFS